MCGIASQKNCLIGAGLIVELIRFFGKLPIKTGMPKLCELIGRLPAIGNTFSTRTHYSRLHLQIAEAIVLALCTDGFAATPSHLQNRLGAEEVLERQQTMLLVRLKLIEWGRATW